MKGPLMLTQNERIGRKEILGRVTLYEVSRKVRSMLRAVCDPHLSTR